MEFPKVSFKNILNTNSVMLADFSAFAKKLVKFSKKIRKRFKIILLIQSIHLFSLPMILITNVL